ncbi:SDR family NAD(P)-dependent oxidoreductase [Streptomyces sp. NPDC087420]|uniref:SDR family NAD(P)-dependent oxidoreductase n=1 Tax=Streptomyces sp. NPDC087420 TaxID=3365785 RepID=UPI00383707AA
MHFTGGLAAYDERFPDGGVRRGTDVGRGGHGGFGHGDPSSVHCFWRGTRSEKRRSRVFPPLQSRSNAGTRPWLNGHGTRTFGHAPDQPASRRPYARLAGGVLQRLAFWRGVQGERTPRVEWRTGPCHAHPSAGGRPLTRPSPGSGSTASAPLDLADPASVATFTDAWTGPLHLLVNNAGVMALPERRLSPTGWEMQFATNHLGHFALATGLHDALAAAGGARIVSLSSRGHLRAPVDFDDVNFATRAYDPLVAYGQSKTANVLFAVEAARRWAEDGIIANTVHPGADMGTNLSRHMPDEVLDHTRTTSHQAFKTLGQGAATTVVVATSPLLAHVTGQYFEDCDQAEVIGPEDTDIPSHARSVVVPAGLPQAYAPGNAMGWSRMTRWWEIFHTPSVRRSVGR